MKKTYIIPVAKVVEINSNEMLMSWSKDVNVRGASDDGYTPEDEPEYGGPSEGGDF